MAATTILDLPVLLIREILSAKNKLSNTDLFSFSLVCKNLYDKRDRYLLFDPEEFLSILLSVKPLRPLEESLKKSQVPKSYFNVLLQSFEASPPSNLQILDSQDNIFTKFYSNILFLGKNKSSDEIPSYSKILYNKLSKNKFNIPGLAESNIERIHNIFFSSEDLGSDGIKPGTLPHKLKYIDFIGQYNIPLEIGSLPNTLVEINLSMNFNQPLIPGLLPHSLKKLTFGSAYNQPFQPNALPPNLESLELPRDYTELLTAGLLPSSLKILTLPSTMRFLPTLNNDDSAFNFFASLPNLVKVISLQLDHLKYLSQVNRRTIKSLEICYTKPFFPSGVTPSISGLIPESVTSLDLNHYYNDLQIGDIPQTVTKLKTREYGTMCFPNSLTHLTTATQQLLAIPNQPWSDNIVSLKFLALRSKYVHLTTFPRNLKKLVLNLVINRPSVFPETLEELEMSEEILYTISTAIYHVNTTVLPHSLKILTLRGKNIILVDDDQQEHPPVFQQPPPNKHFHLLPLHIEQPQQDLATNNIELQKERSRLELIVSPEFFKNGQNTIESLPKYIQSINILECSINLRRYSDSVFVGLNTCPVLQSTNHLMSFGGFVHSDYLIKIGNALDKK